ncbi:MAG TPA: hypothetical protein VKV40_22570 [Ktedonobacteraceae bacterium]|nr:hypothetical protein [Ktedonobacteraceae bacterium]
MPERRYSRYKRADVWAQAYHLQGRLDLTILDGTVYGHSVDIERPSRRMKYRAVVLARSSDWYAFSLNCVDRFRHGLDAVLCGTHDSCLPVPVLALDTMRWYEPLEMRLKSLEPTIGPDGKPVADAFSQRRKSHYGHNMLIGALMCQREDALKRLQSLPRSTRLRIEAKIKRLHQRRAGRPLLVWPLYETPDK